MANKKRTKAQILGGNLWMLSVPELKSLVEKAVRGNWAEADIVRALQASKWYKKHNAAQRQWAQTAADPANRKRIIEETALAMARAYEQATGQGVSPSSYIKSGQAEKVASGNVPLERWVYDLQQAEKKDLETPANEATFADLQNLSNGYLLNLDDQTLNNWTTDIALGKQSPEDFQAWAKAQAAGKFPGYAKQIEAGVVPKTLFGSYTAAASNLLGYEVGFDDPYVQAAISRTGKDGMPIPVWQMEQDIRTNNPRYLYSPDAKAKAASLAEMIGQKFGVIA